MEQEEQEEVDPAGWLAQEMDGGRVGRAGMPFLKTLHSHPQRVKKRQWNKIKKGSPRFIIKCSLLPLDSVQLVQILFIALSVSNKLRSVINQLGHSFYSALVANSIRLPFNRSWILCAFSTPLISFQGHNFTRTHLPSSTSTFLSFHWQRCAGNSPLKMRPQIHLAEQGTNCILIWTRLFKRTRRDSFMYRRRRRDWRLWVLLRIPHPPWRLLFFDQSVDGISSHVAAYTLGWGWDGYQ